MIRRQDRRTVRQEGLPGHGSLCPEDNPCASGAVGEMQEEKAQTPVCVAGMHRSGTSMVTRLLNVCGLHLGAEEDLLPPGPDNAEGYWENASLMKLNDELLARLGGGWDYPPRVREGWELDAALDPLREKARALTRGLAGKQPWGWKDPRNSLTMPFWNTVFPDMKVVICLRNPLEVVHSLHKRGYTSNAFGFNLWLAYNRRLMEAVRPERRIVTHYEAYFIDPREELRRVLGSLGISVPEGAVEEACGTISSSMRHNRITAADPKEAGVPPEVMGLYWEMCGEAGHYLKGPEEKRVEPGEAHEYVCNCNSAVQEKDMIIEAVSAERDDLMEELRNSTRLYEEKIRGLAEKSRKLENALPALREVAEGLRGETLSPVVNVKAGELCFGLGLVEAAREFFLSALAACPENVEATNNMGVLCYQEGDLASAQAFFEKALSLNPHSKEARTNLATLACMESRRGAEEAADGCAVDIIVPVYNAFDETRACLSSVLRHTSPRHRVYVVDDASPDPRIRPYLTDLAARHPNVHLVLNEANKGFIRTVNAAMADSRRDVIVLNSDTVVTAGWVEKMRAAAASSPQVGMVCPLSNNATMMSVPNMNIDNKLPMGMSVDRFGALVEDVSSRLYPTIPTVVGFCMYITRKCLDEVGCLDEAFGLGYGEENDLAMRARGRGFIVKAADDTFVYHSGSTSFKTASGNLDERKLSNERLLGKRWPSYHKEVFQFFVLNPLRDVQQRVHDGISRWLEGDKPHVMQVVHRYYSNAGTELHTRGLATGLRGDYRFTVMFPAGNVLNADAHSSMISDNVMELRYAGRNLSSEVTFEDAPAGLSGRVVESNFERILRNSDAGLVHFQHLLLYGSFGLPGIAKRLGKAVAITLHDYFYLCPAFNLVNADGVMCRKAGPSPEDPECMACFMAKLRVGKKAPDGKHVSDYMMRRREAALRALEAADVVLAPSRYIRDKFAEAMGGAVGDRITVIPHGVEVPAAAAPVDGPGKRLRVAMLGNASRLKGVEVFGHAAKKLKGRDVLMQSFGHAHKNFREKYSSFVRFNGSYDPGDLADIMRKTDVVVIPSVWEETFCYTLSEALAHGVPVVASGVGAMSERVEEGKNGLLFRPGDHEHLAEILAALSEDLGRVREMREHCRARRPLSQGESLEMYRALYKELFAVAAHSAAGP